MKLIFLRRRFWIVSLLALLVVFAGGGMQAFASTGGSPVPSWGNSGQTRTPIKHVIIILGENHSFDNMFGAYQPMPGQTIFNLLSEGIITASGGLGPRASLAMQQQARDTDHYRLMPQKTGPYQT